MHGISRNGVLTSKALLGDIQISSLAVLIVAHHLILILSTLMPSRSDPQPRLNFSDGHPSPHGGDELTEANAGSSCIILPHLQGH